MHPIFQSKKAVMALVASALSFACIKSGFSVQQIAAVIGPLMAYVPMETYLDKVRSDNGQPDPNSVAPKTTTTEKTA